MRLASRGKLFCFDAPLDPPPPPPFVEPDIFYDLQEGPLF